MRHRTAEDFDHAHDLRKHDWRPGDRMTTAQVAAELERLETELTQAVAKSETACKEAMRVIEDLMAQLGVPMAKERTDAQA